MPDTTVTTVTIVAAVTIISTVIFCCWFSSFFMASESNDIKTKNIMYFYFGISLHNNSYIFRCFYLTGSPGSKMLNYKVFFTNRHRSSESLTPNQPDICLNRLRYQHFLKTVWFHQYSGPCPTHSADPQFLSPASTTTLAMD